MLSTGQLLGVTLPSHSWVADMSVLLCAIVTGAEHVTILYLLCVLCTVLYCTVYCVLYVAEQRTVRLECQNITQDPRWPGNTGKWITFLVVISTSWFEN